MKPKTIDEILDNYCYRTWGVHKKSKKQLIELFMSCVPEEKNVTYSLADYGWNDCREQMIKNLEKLK